MNEELESTEENVEVEETTDSRDQELADLKEQIAQLSHSQSQLVAALKQPVVEKKGLDANQLAAMSKDPGAIAAFIQEQTTKATDAIRKESQKETYDRKAYEDFPVLKTDKIYQAEVQKQMKEFVQTGEYQPNDPMLIYRAAQIVAGKVKTGSSGKRSSTQMTSVAPGVHSKTGTTGSSSKIPDNDPRVVMARAMGITEPKRLEVFKASLDGPYVPSAAKVRGRTLRK